MARYFPPLFCDIGSKLIAKAPLNFFLIDENEDYIQEYTVFLGDLCVVDEIIGYGFNIRKIDEKSIFRVMNSKMSECFEFIEKVEVNCSFEQFGFFELPQTVLLLQDFIIKDVVDLPSGQTFYHFMTQENGVILHHLHSEITNEIVLRMDSNEYQKYFEIM